MRLQLSSQNILHTTTTPQHTTQHLHTRSLLTCINMPPFLPRKHLRSPTPEPGPSQPAPAKTHGEGKGKATVPTPRKPTLFDDIDAGTGSRRSLDNKKAALEKLAAASDDESALSSLSSSEDEFEDVPLSKRRKTSPAQYDSEDDEDIEFEDVPTEKVAGASANVTTGDLELTLTKDTRVSITNPYGNKKGPSKIERGIRCDTHKMHVMMLMWHNAVRNAWCCDNEVQKILVGQLGPNERKAVEKWKRDCGMEVEKVEEVTLKKKGKGNGKDVKGKKADARSRGDWGVEAERAAPGQVDMSAGNPLFRLLKTLKDYWKERFRITAPGLRKLGYMSLQRLDEESKSFKEEYDLESHGERIRDIKEFRKCAKLREGSRDVGAQLFTALLRGLGLEARLVASLQPVGHGWSQVEEAFDENPRKLKKPKAPKSTPKMLGPDLDDGSSDDAKPVEKPAKKGRAKGKATSGPVEEDSSEHEHPYKSAKKGKAAAKPKGKPASVTAMRASQRNGHKDAPIDLSASEEVAEEDDDSVVDVTPARQSRKPSLPYDRDLLFPHYWSEVLSPVTNTYTPVDAVVLHLVATNRELIEKFEIRGSKSEKAKQVTAYIIGHSPDGTAKDVTTRYLKRQVWPGRTKGNRWPVEKIAIRNRHGKVKRYEEHDWFKTVMSSYVRGSKTCPRTEIDDHEEATDLKPVKPEKKEVEEGRETLQHYKSSPDFVLERHLKREEAIIPTAKHVKMFTVKSKGENDVEEKVYLRKDVVKCKSMETWHKEGRAPIPGEEPLKRAPYRAATTNRRRELAEAEHASGEKVLQGLYSWDQTEWIIPPPIENGIIPKNNFGNIDLYVESMLPEGAVHLPMRGTVKICKRLGIDYAEAVTGFEFGHRMAVPVITGVVVAEEYYETMMEEWHKEEAERVRKEDEKRRKVALGLWRKMLMGLRIIERFRIEHDGDMEEVDRFNPFVNGNKKADREVEERRREMDEHDEEMAGGFLPEGFDVEEPEERRASFFPVAQEEDENGDEDMGGGFVVEGHDESSKLGTGSAYATPQSLEPPINGNAAASDEDEEMPDPESEPEAIPAPKKRGRPSLPKSLTKPNVKTLAKSIPKPRTSSSKKTSKAETQIQDSEEQEDEESPLSELESDFDPELTVPKKAIVKKATPRRAPTAKKDSVPASTSKGSARKTPKRKAAAVVRSKYFEHSDEEMDVDW